ncbi:MAG: hypothetical protein JWM30_3473 [Burkholderia sp.]|jgi:septal ring factor EnvC (AmiA/AmiB activator)|nr:hypothetical protein [Burkholderia sp.]
MRLGRARLAQEQAALDESKRVAAEAEAERARQQAAADQAAEEARKPAPVVFSRPSDDEIIQVVAKHFGVADDVAYNWLMDMDPDLVFN